MTTYSAEGLVGQKECIRYTTQNQVVHVTTTPTELTWALFSA